MSVIENTPIPDGKEDRYPKINGIWPDLSGIPDDAPPLGGHSPGPPTKYKYNPNCIEGDPGPVDVQPHPPLVDLSDVPDTAPPLGGVELEHEALHQARSMLNFGMY